MRERTTRVLATVGLALVVGLAVAPSAAVADGHETALTVGDATTATGESATVAVTLGEVSDGVAGFDVTLAVADSDVATVDSASVADDFDGVANVSVGENGETVRIAGVDGDDSVTGSAADVRLAAVTLAGESAGETTLAVDTVHHLDADTGDDIATQSTDGTVSVTGETEASMDATTETTGGSGPGFTALAALLAVVGAALIAARR